MNFTEEELNQPRYRFDDQSRQINQKMKALLAHIDAVLAKSKKQSAKSSKTKKSD